MDMGTVKRCHNLVIKGDDFYCKSTGPCHKRICYESEVERIYRDGIYQYREKIENLFSNQEQEQEELCIS